MTHVEYLDTSQVDARFPWLEGRVLAAKYDPIAGWLDSNALIYRFAQCAENATVLLGVQDTRIRTESGKVVGIECASGKIDAPCVVIACGANAIHIGRTAGVELPVVLRPRQSFTTPWRHPQFPADAPMLIAGPPYPHVRPEAQAGAIFGWEYNWRSKHAGDDVARIPDALIEPLHPVQRLKDPRFPSIVLLLLSRQFGYEESVGFANPRYLRGISHNIGYYVCRSGDVAHVTDDEGNRQPYESERAIIDAVPGIEGLFASIAHVGHGIMSAPAAGEIIACKVLDQPVADPLFAQFGFDVPWVEFDENAL
jgi:glycine/D-amino acid oxidase-like deaminating enzyme